MNAELFPIGILPPAGFPHPEPFWFEYSKCTLMAIDKLSINDLLIDNVPGALPPEDTPNAEPIDPKQPDLTSTPHPTKAKAQGQVVGVKMQGGKHMGKHLDCTTGIKSTQNNGIHGIHFSPHATFSMINHLASQWKHGYINIPGIDWTTSKSNHSNWMMPCESYSLNLISGLAMIVGLMMTHISSEQYTTWKFSNISCPS